MKAWLKLLWCKAFHRYTGHLGFVSGGRTDWMCCECGCQWQTVENPYREMLSPHRPDKK